MKMTPSKSLVFVAFTTKGIQLLLEPGALMAQMFQNNCNWYIILLLNLKNNNLKVLVNQSILCFLQNILLPKMIHHQVARKQWDWWWNLVICPWGAKGRHPGLLADYFWQIGHTALCSGAAQSIKHGFILIFMHCSNSELYKNEFSKTDLFSIEIWCKVKCRPGVSGWCRRPTGLFYLWD